MNLKELKDQRDALDREIKDREAALVQFSMHNLEADLGYINVAPDAKLEQVAKLAASCGLALTTTKNIDDRGTLDLLKTKYFVEENETFAEIAMRIVAAMGGAK